MKVLLAGVGDFGSGWLKDVLLQDKTIEVCGVADKNPENLALVEKLECINKSLLYSDVRQAIIDQKPDFLLNVTPPAVHKAVNLIAFEFGIPILCEKPIAEDIKDVMDIYQKSKEHNVPIMIAENYRYDKLIRTTKELISSGEIGTLNSVHVDFHRRLDWNQNKYILQYPLLMDVAIHHLDVVRYLTGAEATTVYARSWNPEWSWYKGDSRIDILLDMHSHIKVSYCGSLTSFDQETGWQGVWRIEGDKGVLGITEDRIILRNNRENNSPHVIEMSERTDSRKQVLKEFIRSLAENRKGETDIEDNLKTYIIAQCAIESIKSKQPVECPADCNYSV